MANFILKEQARNLREKQGASIREISDKLKISSSTVRYWCQDIVLSHKQLQKLIKKQKEGALRGSIKYAEKLRLQRRVNEQKYKRMGQDDVQNISTRDLFIAGLSLYWAEGYKNSNGEIGFTNSDPRMIKLILVWFKKIYKINKEDLIFRIGINEIHKDRGDKILKFWSNYLDVSRNQFTKTSFIKTVSKKVYSNSDKYFGTLRVKVRRGTNLRNRILGAIEFMAKK